MIYKIKSYCRRRCECIGIRANCGKSLPEPCFFSYGFLTHGQDIEMAHTSPPETRRTSLSAYLPLDTPPQVSYDVVTSSGDFFPGCQFRLFRPLFLFIFIQNVKGVCE